MTSIKLHGKCFVFIKHTFNILSSSHTLNEFQLKDCE